MHSFAADNRFVHNFDVLERHTAKGMPGPEYVFVLIYLGSVVPETVTELEWSSLCFQNGSASISEKETTVSITVKLDCCKTFLCDEAYFLTTPFQYETLDMALLGSKTVTWKIATATEVEDVKDAGVCFLSLPQIRSRDSQQCI
jgi:hypothetical protein